ncbi:MAG: hypothetical protein ACE5LU_02045 [Anaerolineae bacterium]
MKKLLLFSATLALTTVLTGSAVRAAGLNRSSDEIALWNGPSPGLGIIVYTIDLDQGRGTRIHRVYEGINVGTPDYLFNDRHFFNGLNRADPLYTFSSNGERIYAGATVAGEPVYFLQPIGEGIRVHRGPNNKGTILYTFFQNRVYAGANTLGTIVLSTDSNLLEQDAPVIQVITILLEMAPRAEEPETVDALRGVSLQRTKR